MSLSNSRNKISKIIKSSSEKKEQSICVEKVSDKNDELNLKKIENSIPGFFLRHSKFSWMLFLMAFLMGIMSVFSIRVEFQPSIKFPMIIITTPYMGASPEDVESLVTEEIEDAIANIDDVKQYTSTSTQGMSMVRVEFFDGVDVVEKINEVKTELDKIKTDLPEDGDSFTVFDMDVNDKPIITLNVLGDSKYTQRDLYIFGETVQKSLEDLKEVSKVEIYGGQERAFEIKIDPQKLDIHKINISQVVSALKNYNINIPIGSLKIKDYYYSIRQEGKFNTISDIANIPIVQSPNRPAILIKDVASVIDGGKDMYSISKLGRKDEGIQTAITLAVYKKEGQSILTFSDNVLEKIENVEGLPSDVETFIVQNLSEYTREDLENLSNSGLMTLIVIFIVLLSVGFKEAIITTLSVPLSFAITFIVLNALGYSLNNVTLFSLILSLGLLVDTAIVVVEGCHEYVTKGYSGYKSALLSLKDFKSSLLAGTFTTVSAFFPMFFMGGKVGQFISIIPLTVTIVLITSLCVALTFNTLLASNILKPNKKKKVRKSIVVLIYKVFMKKILKNKSTRWIVFTFSLLAICISIFVVKPQLQTSFFPQEDEDYFSIKIEGPSNIELDYMIEATEKVEDILLKNEFVESFSVDIGGSSSGNTHNSFFTVSMITDRKDLNGKQVHIIDVVNMMDKDLSGITGVKINVEKPNMGPPVSHPISFYLIGNDFEELELNAKELVRKIENIEGVHNPDTDIRYGAGEFTFNIDREEALKKGFLPVQIAQDLRTIINGNIATTVRVDGQEVDVVVKVEDDEINSISDLENIVLTSKTGVKFKVRDIAEVHLGTSLTGISHRDGKKVVEVYSFIKGKNERGESLTSDAILKNIMKVISVECLPKELREKPTNKALVSDFEDRILDYRFENHLNEICISDSIEVQFGGDKDEMSESMGSLLNAVIFGLMGILAILVLQFNSFRQPLIVLYTIPLSLIGVFPGLLLVGVTLSIPTWIGVAALTGIVVNDAIILVTRINQKISSCKGSIVDCLVSASVSRWKPIMITTITTAVGIFPLVFIGEFYACLGWAIIFGLLAASVLTVVVIPVLYVMSMPKKYKERL